MHLILSTAYKSSRFTNKYLINMHSLLTAILMMPFNNVHLLFKICQRIIVTDIYYLSNND